MVVVTFNSTNKYGQCAQFLEELSKDARDQDEDVASNFITISTGKGPVSVPRRVMELMSPLVREIVASLPVTAVHDTLTFTVPDTDPSTVRKMMDLLLTGQTSINTRKCQEDIMSLAENLGVKVENLVMERKRKRVHSKENIKPNFNSNNNYYSVTSHENAAFVKEEPPDIKFDKNHDVSENVASRENIASSICSLMIKKPRTVPAAYLEDLDPRNSNITSNPPNHDGGKDIPKYPIPQLSSTKKYAEYRFNYRYPIPNPRWSSKQQVMMEIPAGFKYSDSDIRNVLDQKGHVTYMWISKQPSWYDKNQAKYGYVVFTEPEDARRLLDTGYVRVGHDKVAVRMMRGGQPYSK